jgi:hypothetical protein
MKGKKKEQTLKSSMSREIVCNELCEGADASKVHGYQLQCAEIKRKHCKMSQVEMGTFFFNPIHPHCHQSKKKLKPYLNRRLKQPRTATQSNISEKVYLQYMST